MPCSHCATPLPATARFCMACGEPVQWQVVTSADAESMLVRRAAGLSQPLAGSDPPPDRGWIPSPLVVRQDVHLVLQARSANSGMGAVVVYAAPTWRGWGVQLGCRPLIGEPTPEFVATVVERVVEGHLLYAAVFPRVPGRAYRVEGCARSCDISVFAGAVVEVDWSA